MSNLTPVGRDAFPLSVLAVTASPVPVFSADGMETVVIIAIAVLATVFLGALLGLLILCRQKFCQKGVCGFYRGDKHCSSDMRPDVHLIETDAELELGDVCLHPDIKEILANEQWIGDATGLVPHTLAVLRACHALTDRLAALTMGPLAHNKTGAQIINVAKRISPRVDDVVRSMYPPLDARLLEARTAALALAVTNLALITRHGCLSGSRLDWIDSALASMDSHLAVLREAALTQELSSKIQNNTDKS